jgi:hypothetical protein
MALAGKDTTLWVGASPAKVLGIESVNVGAATDKIKTTSLGDSWDTFIAGIKTGDEINATGHFEVSDTTGQIALRTAWLAGTAIACEVRNGATVPKVAFSAMIAGFSTGAALTGPVTVSIKIQPSGAFTYTDA